MTETPSDIVPRDDTYRAYLRESERMAEAGDFTEARSVVQSFLDQFPRASQAQRQRMAIQIAEVRRRENLAREGASSAQPS